ncbi:protein ROH1-like [Impatiens glandulifera]|uniref:protein ROH1-like n=1 Tax=Impatiens glandulifera TaxID=253017 RepID=UPI001FB06ABF|nr:protein ROH1-like [Impatiens glandulifera]
MPPSDHQETSSVPFSAIRRVISSIRSDQIHAMEINKDANIQNPEFELFHKHVFDRFHHLSEPTSDDFLSISWIQKLLDAFFTSLEEFRVLLSKNTDRLQKPAMDKILSEFFDKSIKALDICNAIRDGIEKIRVWQKHLEIVLSALDGKQRTATGEGNFRRARKALMELSLMMLDEKESGSGSSMFQQRNRSFNRHNSVGIKDRQSRHSRSLSWSVSRSWSASKQLQSIANNLIPPRGNEVIASNGLANPIYTMSSVLMFVLWTLVAAIPCQDRGLNAHFSFGRNLNWAVPMVLIQERILEEGRKREHRSCNGLMKEVVDMEKCVRRLTEMVDSVRFPVTEERKEEVGKGVEELERIVSGFKKSNDPLEKQLRLIFHKIMSCRTEGLELLNQAK